MLADVLADPRRKYGPPEDLHRVVPGFTRAHLAQEFAKRGYTKGAEIGVADGRYSLTLCQAIPNLELMCVDTWAPYPGNPRGGPREQHEKNFALAHARLLDYNVQFLREPSAKAVTHVPHYSLDFVYIDANHSLPYVTHDLVQWGMRVRKGGIIAGHDYYHFKHAGVVEAVRAYVACHNLTDWHLCDEREPSFWWVKQAHV